MVRARLRRLRRMALPILQCSIAAALAWLVATEVFEHSRPFFAPIAVCICIGVGFGQKRLRRVVELVIGVSVGIGVGDVLVYLIGTGPWQLALVLTLAMTVAVLLGSGPLIMLQAASSAVLVVTLLPPGDTAAFDRMVDALIGGVLGVAAIAVLPGNAPALARRRGQQVFDELAAALTAAADAIDRRDRELAVAALTRVRGQQAMADFRDALQAARETGVVSPFHVRQRHELDGYVAAVEPLDLAVRNARVLLRRTASALTDDEPIPAELSAGLRQLANVATGFAPVLDTEDASAPARVALRRAGSTVSADSLSHSGFSAKVVAAQLRSITVDLLRATGLEHTEARAKLPPM
jgi:uncharacterized membrane protein YgaE (UPF0421/DUF939 family)